MNEIKIKTPEGIAFSLPLAGPVARCMALLLDTFVIMLIWIAVSKLESVIGLLSKDWLRAILTISGFVLMFGYYIALEWFWGGQTVGKWLLRLRVVDASGLRLQFRQIAIRNLLRLVDLLPIFYALGGTVCLANRRRQRLGDLAADTIVIFHPQIATPDLAQIGAGKFNSLRQYPHLQARLRQRISPQIAGLLLQSLLRRDTLDAAARIELFGKLADYCRKLVAFPPEAVEALSDEQYLRNVVDLLYQNRNPAAVAKPGSPPKSAPENSTEIPLTTKSDS